MDIPAQFEPVGDLSGTVTGLWQRAILHVETDRNRTPFHSWNHRNFLADADQHLGKIPDSRRSARHLLAGRGDHVDPLLGSDRVVVNGDDISEISLVLQPAMTFPEGCGEKQQSDQTGLHQ